MKWLFNFLCVFISCNSFAGHNYPEKYYQQQTCTELGGVTEYTLPDKTRVDCLTDTYAIEFDFAPKWAESIGQALYYANQTNRKPAVALIIENGKSDMRYVTRLTNVATIHDITVWLIYP